MLIVLLFFPLLSCFVLLVTIFCGLAFAALSFFISLEWYILWGYQDILSQRNYARKIGKIHKDLLNLAWCYATSINPLLIYFLNTLRCLRLLCRAKSDMINNLRIILIKIYIIKVNMIKISTRNTHFITRKCDITRIFIQKYIIICKLSSLKLFNHYTCNK